MPFGVSVPGYPPMVSPSGVRNVLGAPVVLEELSALTTPRPEKFHYHHAAVGKFIIENFARGIAP